jgi:TadE-like protein
MTQRSFFSNLRNNCEASTAAEFALVLPILILFLLGIIDVGRTMWLINTAEKATQIGARMAVVTDMVPGGLYAENYGATLGQGAAIPLTSFGAARCNKPATTVSCDCLTTPCPTLTPLDAPAFDAIVTRMRQISSIIGASNVEIVYANSGLGYAGDPNGADVAPLVTVTARNLSFTPLLFQIFGASFALPPVSASLTMEDGAGTVSN